MVSQAGALPASVNMALTKIQKSALEEIKAWATPEREFNAELVRQLVNEAEILLSKAESIARTENIPFSASISGLPQSFGTPIMKDLDLFHEKDNYSYGSEFRASEMLKMLEGIKGAEQLVSQIEDIIGSDSIETQRTYGWDKSEIC